MIDKKRSKLLIDGAARERVLKKRDHQKVHSARDNDIETFEDAFDMVLSPDYIEYDIGATRPVRAELCI